MYSVTLTETPAAITRAEQDAAIPDDADGDEEAKRRYAEEAKIAHETFVQKRAFLSNTSRRLGAYLFNASSSRASSS